MKKEAASYLSDRTIPARYDMLQFEHNFAAKFHRNMRAKAENLDSEQTCVAIACSEYHP
jgi:hypothetical protein